VTLDPRLDVVGDAIDVPGGRIAFVRPRDGDALPLEQDPSGGEEYPAHWAQPWPSGIELARAVAVRDWSGAAVVELGCGLGLPAVAAALTGARVLATDRSATAVAFAAANAGCNGIAMDTAVCAWSVPGLLLGRAPWRLVLAADVLYGHRNVVELLDLLPRLVDRTGEVWLADPQRPLAGEFLAAARNRWRRVDTVATGSPEILIHRLAEPLDAGDPAGP
jgi:predicted nicotinamide N-methyase